MTDHELQLKAVALRRARAAVIFQPEWLAEYSPGLRAALPWVCVPKISSHPEGVREPFAPTTTLAPFQGAKYFWDLTQGSSRRALTTPGYTLIALQAIFRQRIFARLFP